MPAKKQSARVKRARALVKRSQRMLRAMRKYKAIRNRVFGAGPILPGKKDGKRQF